MRHLFTLQTSAVRLTWSLRQEQPPPVPQVRADPPFGLSAQALQPGIVPAVHVAAAAPTHLFEETGYTVLLQSKSETDPASSAGQAVRLRHRDPALLRGLAVEGGVVHGRLNFGSQVGTSRFVIELGGAPHVAFEVEVFPSKLDYRDDYERLRTDVEALADELAFAYLRATYTPAAPLPERTSGLLARLLLLRHALGDLERALEPVAARPERGVVWERHAVRAERVRRPDAAVRRAARRESGLAEGERGALRLPSRGARYTLDTPEHRWLAYELRQIALQLRAAREAESAGRPSLRLRATVRELEGLEWRVEQLRRRVPTEAPPTPPAPTLRLTRAPAYREAYRACLLLRHGVRVAGGPLELALKDLHELYELWCFLTLVRLAAEVAGRPLPAAALVRPERRGLHLRLRHGLESAVALELDGGGRLTITNNPRFGGPDLLVPQQPDVLLSLRRPGGPTRHAVLDAKYRLDASPGYRRRYGLPGPPTDALGDLHRYRDAIRIGGERAVTHAVALFPYRESRPGEWAASRHRRALLDLGVGAIPLLPGETHPLRRWLRDWLG